MRSLVLDVPFEDAQDVTSICLRLHPLDVGFDLRGERMPVDVSADPSLELRVSYADREGACRVMSGPRTKVLRRLRLLGYVVREDNP